jgi:hypothetical protein
MLKNNYQYFLFIILLVSCKTNNSPSEIKMKECLSNELSNKAIVESYEQQDGLTREKDGVKYYEGYFNAEVKFITNTGEFKAGQRCKIIKATLSFMKTENGWNCQDFNIAASNIVKIKEQSENSEHINAKVEQIVETQVQPNQTTSLPSSTVQTNSDIFEPGYYLANGNDDRKIYFHNAAETSTKRKAYLSTQENVYVQKIQNGFGYIEFTNTKGVSSYGWVEMKYLISRPN